jgi:hypothetical protein
MHVWIEGQNGSRNYPSDSLYVAVYFVESLLWLWCCESLVSCWTCVLGVFGVGSVSLVRVKVCEVFEYVFEV